MVWECSWSADGSPSHLPLQSHWSSTNHLFIAALFLLTAEMTCLDIEEPFWNIDFNLSSPPFPACACVAITNMIFQVATLLPLENKQRLSVWTLNHKIHSVMTQTEETVEGESNPTLSLSLSLSLSFCLSLCESLRRWRGVEFFSKHILELIMPSLLIEKRPGGAGLWAGVMVMSLRGSERSVVECSCP